MKKIGVLNFQHSDHNYGAVLQAVALARCIENLGFEPEHINLIPKAIKRDGDLLSFIKKTIKGVVGKNNSVLPKVYGNHIFESFRSKWLNRTNELHTKEQLASIVSFYSAVVVGSDQVWRPSYTREFALSYFLDFCPENVKRISYAASFGIDYWDTRELIDDVKEELHKFDSLSVRELSGVDVCRNTFDVEAVHVLDPTLLVGRDFFEEIIEDSNVIDEPELVYYKLGVEKKFIELIQGISNDRNWKKENIYYFKDNGKLRYNHVANWLAKIKNSKFVVADSFHCVCFSILFEKEFIYYPNESKGITRLESLLGGLGLVNRVCLKESDVLKVIKSKIDYIEVNSKLELLREQSIKFLGDALNE